MVAHGLFGGIGITGFQRIQNHLMLVPRHRGSPFCQTRPETIEPEHIVKLFAQGPFDPHIAAGTNDHDMEIIIGAQLIIGFAGRHFRILGVAFQNESHVRQRFIRNAGCRHTGSHTFQRFTHFIKGAQIFQRERHNPRTQMGRAGHQSFGFKTENRFTRRTAAHTETVYNFDFTDRSTRLNLA